jgi:hypothetical protein
LQPALLKLQLGQRPHDGLGILRERQQIPEAGAGRDIEVSPRRIAYLLSFSSLARIVWRHISKISAARGGNGRATANCSRPAAPTQAKHQPANLCPRPPGGPGCPSFVHRRSTIPAGAGRRPAVRPSRKAPTGCTLQSASRSRTAGGEAVELPRHGLVSFGAGVGGGGSGREVAASSRG